jgi:hypothetical protein
VSVASAPGRGSTIRITLPLGEAATTGLTAEPGATPLAVAVLAFWGSSWAAGGSRLVAKAYYHDGPSGSRK